MSIRKRTWNSGDTEKFAWLVDYRDAQGERRFKQFEKKKDAVAWEASTKVSVSEGTQTPDSQSITVIKAWENWLADGDRNGLERSTVEQREQHLRLHVKPSPIGRVKLSKLTAPMVKKQFVKWLQDNGRSRAMVQKVLTSLKTMLSHAQSEGDVAQNVARGIKFSLPKRDEEEAVFPTRDEIRKLINEAEGRWRPLILTAIFTGLRASELRGLAWDNVDLDNSKIKVRQRADRWNTIGKPKTKAGRRDVPLAPIVVNILREWKLQCPKGDLNLVFPSRNGTVLHYSNLWRRVFVRLMVKCGMVEDDGRPRFKFHALRHAAASLFIEQGWQPKRVQAVMGHASMAMTYDLYGHLWPDAEGDQADMEQIQARLLG